MSPAARLWLLVTPAAAVVGAAATALTATSNHLDVPRLQAVLIALTGGSFIAAGLIARTRRPLNRTGWLLIAVGFAWFAGGGLMGAKDSLPWTIGIALSALPAGFLIHLLLAYPSGRLHSRWETLLVATGYVLVTAGNVSHMPVQPDLLASCDTCPSNAFLVSDQPTAADALALSLRSFAAVFLLAVVVTLVRRWRESSPAARRILAPVLLAGGTSLFFFAVMVGAESFSPTVAEIAGWIAQVVLIGLPFLFLTGLLKSRLARADISRAVVEAPTGGAQARVRELLHDPTAELLYACAEPSRGYVDVDGRPRELVAGPGRAITTIEGEGRPVAAIVHDEALLDEPELLEQVAATVGLEIERDQNLFALQASERRSRALIEAIPDNMFRIAADGTFLDIQEGPGAPPVQAKVGTSVYDYPVPPKLIDRVMEAGTEALRTGELQTLEWELGEEGDLRYQEGRFVPSGEQEFFLVVRDVTDRKRQEGLQVALHRVALAVAAEARSEHIFHLVAAEVGRLLGADAVKLLRYEPDGERAALVGYWSERGDDQHPLKGHAPVPMAGNPMHLVYETGLPIRVDLKQPMRPELAGRLRKHRINSIVAAPITVSGRLWGVVAASLEPPHFFWRGAEERLGAFTQLVSLALANEEARRELEASRARLVSAGDEERRRLERNLHDGAQQRLVSLSLSLRLAQSKLTSDPQAATELLAGAGGELDVALEELRELARGIHPAVLTERGLGPALNALADRAPLPVELELPPERLPRRVEAAAYYVVSEALANVAKYARASEVTVTVAQENGSAVVEVADDGIGGADPETGSGLRGLTDRIEALDGHLHVVSPTGRGTRIRAEIPCELPQAETSGTPS